MPDPTADREQIGQLPSSGTPRVADNFYWRMVKGVLPYYYSHVYLSANQSIPNGSSTWTTIDWDTQQDDAHNLWVSGSPGLLTLPEAGIWQIEFQVGWDATVATGQRGMRLLAGATAIAELEILPGTVRAVQRLTTVARLAANTAITAQLTQNSGGAINALGGSANPYVSFIKAVELWRP